MTRPINVLIGLAAIGAMAGLPNVAHAQEQDDKMVAETVAADSILADVTVTLTVEGMVCPFCAYGLERQLRKIEALDSVIIRISDGVVQIREKDGQKISDKTLHEAVTRAGFTLREIDRHPSE